MDLCEPEEKEQIHKQIQSKGGTLNYPTTVVDDKKLIAGFRKDQLKEALGL